MYEPATPSRKGDTNHDLELADRLYCQAIKMAEKDYKALNWHNLTKEDFITSRALLYVRAYRAANK